MPRQAKVIPGTHKRYVDYCELMLDSNEADSWRLSMNALQRTNDATMDDIMASIRRIVGDEQTQKPMGFNNEPIKPANDFREPLRKPIYDLTERVDSIRSLDPRSRVADIDFIDRVATPQAESLLSTKTNAAVMASFEQLSQNFARSSDAMNEIVKEMMKPMLKQWLDENLPPIVEKIVRAEIERVARGVKNA
jgi:uncharacterized protein